MLINGFNATLKSKSVSDQTHYGREHDGLSI